MKQDNQWLQGFRHSSPYINAHRGRTVVLALGGEALAHENLVNIIHDMTLLASLGVRLVVVFGARPQIQQRLEQAGHSSRFHQGLRVTTEADLPLVQEAIGQTRSLLESQLSMGLVNSPMHGARIRALGGNLVTARPVGVLDGVDFAHTGRVRRVDVEGINLLLGLGAVVLLPPLGYSPTGDAFNLSYEEVASEAAVALGADKLILLTGEAGILDAGGRLEREMTVREARTRTEAGHPEGQLLRAAAEACARGVRRTHIISYARDGALLEELFTRDGTGTLVTDEDYEQVRPARAEDISGIQELIQPLEEQGILVRRPRELIETEIERFVVDERDGGILGCAALYVYAREGIAELACFAVSNQYRRSGRGDRLLRMVERQARAQGVTRLFVLTTQAEHWFRERGFEPAGREDLPRERQKGYSAERNSKIFIKTL